MEGLGQVGGGKLHGKFWVAPRMPANQPSSDPTQTQHCGHQICIPDKQIGPIPENSVHNPLLLVDLSLLR